MICVNFCFSCLISLLPTAGLLHRHDATCAVSHFNSFYSNTELESSFRMMFQKHILQKNYKKKFA